jgi:tetratricopeptide (TPR) repeat protein
MTRAGQAATGLLATGLTMALAAGVLSARDATSPLDAATKRLLYLRSGQAADRLFLHFDALAADVYWIRTIQHYGRDRRSTRQTDRFELLQPLLDLTTTLDPYFNVVYRFGAIFLAMEPPNGPGRTDQAIALLQKGLRSRPGRWQYAHDIGFIHYWHTGNYTEAAAWFERAGAMPGSPEWLPAIAAITLATGGDRAGARRLLEELLTSNEAYLRQAGERGLAKLGALDAIDDLQALIERFHAATGRYPASWGDLIRAGWLRGPPADATATPFVYDPASHQVTLSPQSPLAPLPRGLGRR